MSKYHVDRDTDYMYKMWGTTSLITDYWKHPKNDNKRVIQEIMHDDLEEDQKNLKESND